MGIEMSRSNIMCEREVSFPIHGLKGVSKKLN